jgi:hypothetical protein
VRHHVTVRAYPDSPAEELALPVTLDEYAELWRTLEAEREAGRLDVWKYLMRQWSAGDGFFFLLFVLSPGRDAWNSHRQEQQFKLAEHLALARRIQFDDADNAVLIGGRTFGKSTQLVADDIRHKLLDANDASTWFSLTRELCQKKGGAIQKELEENQLLLGLWPDRFWRNAEERPSSTKWSLRDGLCIKRTSTRPEQSWEFHAFEKRLPTGTHPDGRYYDDIEAEGSAESIDVLATVERRWVSSQRLHSDRPRRRTTGTYYAQNGLMMKLSGEYGLKTWLYPAEDLSRKEPDRRLAGPLGGTPANGFTAEQLWAELASSGGARRDEETGAWRRTGNKIALKDYGLQMACNPLAGESARLDWNLIRVYSAEHFARVRRRSTAVICVDPSRGDDPGADPTYIWVWLLTPERDFLWADAERRVVDPRKRCALIFQVCAKWQAIAQDTQLRIEQFGASEAYQRQVEYHDEQGFSIVTLNCHDTRKSKMARAWERWQPPCAAGKVYFPRELRREDENGNEVDLVADFKVREFDPFPQPDTDHGLDSGGLLWESEDRVGALPWPTPQKPPKPPSAPAGYASAGVL